ncbi:MAG: DUF58 domain-containing protein [Crocinitomicaceae bacterium]|nr:DUF58 domain-containing protein [Crocinitomicaceae bacterium]
MFRSIYITRLFFVVLAAIALVFVGAFTFPLLLAVGQIALVSLAILTLVDILVVFAVSKPIIGERQLSSRMDLGDEHTVVLRLVNRSPQPYFLEVFDEPPLAMQARDLNFTSLLRPKKEVEFSYIFTPKKRGAFKWGDLHILLRSAISLVKRKVILYASETVTVYPSVAQMKKYEFYVFHQQTQQKGIKKIRRLGHNNEFEQIKNYVQGDDIRTLNWKATSRKNELMVNQYQEERSQNIYSIIDKSRAMEHDFEEMTLLDYAINSTLVFTNIALRKGDKVGVFTYSDKVGSKLAANSGANHLQKVMELLYNQKTHFKEADFGLLFQTIRQNIRNRSLIMLYTNFDTELGMRRALPLLKRIARNHLLVVVFFENTKLQEVVVDKPSTLRDVYVSAVAEDIINVKRRIAIELNRNGIHTVLTKPEDLNVQTINKYLEFKSRGMI